jgi:DNA-binding NarL/FixJ family response regulator
MPLRVFVSSDATSSGITGRPKVLVVEDDYLVAMEIEIGLTEAGFDVIGPARLADEAEDLALKHGPKLVVMDIRLASRRDGVDAALAIFRTLGIRSIFATAHQDPQTLARAEPAAPLGWLSKPYSIDCLIARVREAVTELEGQR